jgi:hypothetical protein
MGPPTPTNPPPHPQIPILPSRRLGMGCRRRQRLPRKRRPRLPMRRRELSSCRGKHKVNYRPNFLEVIKERGERNAGNRLWSMGMCGRLCIVMRWLRMGFTRILRG